MADRIVCRVVHDYQLDMFLHIIFESKEVGRVDYVFSGIDFESLMELLNRSVQSPVQVQAAFYMDPEGQRIELPLAAFDGEPIGCRLQSLQRAYQKIISL